MSYFDQLLAQAEANDKKNGATGATASAATAQKTTGAQSTDTYFDQLMRQAEQNDTERAHSAALATERADELDKMNTPSASRQAAAQQPATAAPTTTDDKFSLGKLLTGGVRRGVTQAGTAISSTLSWLESALFAPLEAITGYDDLQELHGVAYKLNEQTHRERDTVREQYAANTAKGGKAAQIAEDVIAGTTAAIPQAITAFMSSGTSLGVAGAQGLEATALAAQQSPTLLNSLRSAIVGMANDPNYWTSFLQTAGNSYEEAKADGADDSRASLYALSNGLFNAAIEVGGGLETLPEELRGGRATFLRWLQSAKEEGSEEVWQGIVERGLQNLIYGKKNPIASLTDENAVLNPITSAKEFGMGAAIGGILGGGQMALAGALNTAAGQNTTNPTNTQAQQQTGTTAQQETTAPAVNNQQDVTQQATQQSAKTPLQIAVDATMASGRASNSVIDRVIADKGTMAQLGVNTNGLTASQTRAAVRDAVSNIVARTVAPQRAASRDAASQATLDAALAATTEAQEAARQARADALAAEREANQQRLAQMFDSALKAQQTQQDVATPAPVDAEARQTAAEGNLTPAENRGAEGAKKALEREAAKIPENTAAQEQAREEFTPTDVNTEQRGDFGNATGAAQQGFSVSHSEQVPTQNRTITDSNIMTEEERAQFPPQTHERISEAQSIERARQQFYADENGNITNLDDTIRTLSEKEAFRGEDQDAVMLAMRHVLERSRAERSANGAVSEETQRQLQELVDLNERIGATVAGQSLQARQKWINTPQDIISRSQRILENAREHTNTQGILDTITDLALEFDDAMDAGNWASVADIIRRTSRFRRTGNLFTNRWSRTMENALNHVVEQATGGDESAQDFLENHAANGLVAIAQDFTPTGTATGLLTIRRNAMLSKISTTMRNFISNNVFDPIDSVSRDISVPLDMLLSRATGTRSTAIDRSWLSAEKRHGAMEGLERSILEVGLDVDASGERGRYENGAQRTFSMQGGAVSRLLSTWEKHLGYRLYSTDQFQKGGIAAEIQRGLDELYERGLITDNSLENGGATEALYRTFQDETQLSKLSIRARQALNAIQFRGHDLHLGDIAIPFAQVPANLGTRALEYSPVGIADGFFQLGQVLRAAHNGTLTAAQQARAVQSIGRGLNGTALIAGAVALALKGVLHVADVGGDEDKDKKALEKAAGITGTQVNLSALERWANGESTDWRDGDVLHGIGYLDPLNAMLTTGALIAQDYESDDPLTLSRLLKDTLEGTIQSVLDIPVMTTLKDTAEAYHYSTATTEGGKLVDAGKEFAAGQVSSIIPNSIKGIAQGTDRYQRDAYTSNSVVGQTWDAIRASLPVLREQLPEKTDNYGQPIENVDPLLNFINANISPGTYVRYQRPQQGVTAELDRLSDVTGDNGVYPSRSAPNSVTNSGNKYELTADEKEQFKQTAGAEFLKFATAIINGRQYSALSDSEKADAISSAVVYANARARQQLINSKGGSYTLTGEARTVEKAMEARGAGIDPSEFFVLKVVHDEINNGDGTAAQKATKFAQYLNRQTWLTDAKRETIQELLTYSSGFRAEANDKALAAEQYGVSIDEFYKAKAAMDADGNGNLKKDEVMAYLNANYPADKRRALFELFGGGNWKNPY